MNQAEEMEQAEELPTEKFLVSTVIVDQRDVTELLSRAKVD